jgi:hypothetical protein
MNTTIALNAPPAVRRDERSVGHRLAARAIRLAAFTGGHEQAVETQLSFLRRHLLDGAQASAAHAPASFAAAA